MEINTAYILIQNILELHSLIPPLCFQINLDPCSSSSAHTAKHPDTVTLINQLWMLSAKANDGGHLFFPLEASVSVLGCPSFKRRAREMEHSKNDQSYWLHSSDNPEREKFNLVFTVGSITVILNSSFSILCFMFTLNSLCDEICIIFYADKVF